MKLFAVLPLLALTVYAYDKEKVKVVSNTEVKPAGHLGDTGDFQTVGNGEVKGNFAGSRNGPIKGKSGDVKATQQGSGDKVVAYGPDGRKANGDIHKGGKSGEFVDDRGNKVVAEGGQESDIHANVNGKDQYKVIKQGTNAQVFPKNSNTASNTVENLNSNSQPIRIETPNKPERVESVVREGSDFSGSDAENTVPRVPIGQSNNFDLNHERSSKTEITLGKSLGVTNNRKLQFGAGAEVKSDEIQTAPCFTGPSGSDALGNSGIKINDKSIKFELIKNSNGEYEFPSCYWSYASVYVPPGIDVSKLAVHNQVGVPLAGGEMQCDAKVACLDRTTPNRPAGTCFFCNFCDKSQPQGAFGLGSEANVCDAKAGTTLPLKWKVCPPESQSSRFRAFSASGQKIDGDIVSIIRLYLKESKGWNLVACKQSVYKFRAGLANQNPVGSVSSNRQLSKDPSGGGAAAGGLPQGGLGGLGGLFKGK